MSLKVWLPLDGNLNNYGASNITVTNNNATTNSAGKIGSCYYFKNAILNLPNSILNSLSTGHDFSFSCWYKVNTFASSDDCIFHASKSSTSWNGMVFWFGPRKDNNKLELCVGNANSGYKVGYSSSTLTTGVWYHLAFTYSNTVAKIYINGILDSTITGVTTPNYSQITLLNIGGYATNVYSVDGYLNDIRIYDECLSAGEVKEISQALVLHYPLDSPNDIMRNKYSGENADGKCSTGYPTWTKTELSGERGYNYKLTYTGTSSAFYAYLRFPHFTFTVGKRYYYSVKIRCNKWTAGGLQLRASRSENDWATGMVAVCNSTLADGKWHEYYMSTIINSTYDRSGTTVTCDPLMEFYTGNLNSSGTVYEFDFDMKDVQVVESDIYVPFIDNGLPQYTIHDCSGYNRNGAVTASTCPIISGGCPRNRYCYQFDGTDDYINSVVKETEILSDKKFTVSAWVYPTECTNYRGAFGSHRNYAGFWFAQCSSSGITFSFGTGSAWATYIVDTNYTLNAWTHYAMVYDGSKAIVYKNGAKLGESSGSITLYADDYLWVGKAYQNTDRFWKGKISDVKLYATALSADDISVLYRNFASMYNSGSLASYDMRENI